MRTLITMQAAATDRRSGVQLVRAHASRGFTLLEALMACGILLVIVVAVTSAVSAGQQHAYYAHQRIAATLAAEEWMGRLEAMNYRDLASMHEVEAVGTMLDVGGESFPESFQGVGREAWVTPTYLEFENPKVQFNGMTIRVRAFDKADRTLADISCFVPQPPVDSLPEAEAESYAGDENDGGSGGGLIGALIKGLFGW